MRKFLTLLVLTLLLSGCELNATNIKIQPQLIPGKIEAYENHWVEVQPGLAYGKFTITYNDIEREVYLIKVDPQKYQFSFVENKSPENPKDLRSIHQENKSLFSFNGSFFTEEFKPTGYLKDETQEAGRISNADLLNGIFVINKKVGTLLDQTQKDDAKSAEFAIQNGPILLNNQGERMIKTDTGKTASRTAIGIDQSNQIVIIIMKQDLSKLDNSLSLFEFTEMLKIVTPFKELGLRSVLNLDGGPSTGMMIGETYLPPYDDIQNVIIVKERKT